MVSNVEKSGESGENVGNLDVRIAENGNSNVAVVVAGCATAQSRYVDTPNCQTLQKSQLLIALDYKEVMGSRYWLSRRIYAEVI